MIALPAKVPRTMKTKILSQKENVSERILAVLAFQYMLTTEVSPALGNTRLDMAGW